MLLNPNFLIQQYKPVAEQHQQIASRAQAWPYSLDIYLKVDLITLLDTVQAHPGTFERVSFFRCGPTALVQAKINRWTEGFYITLVAVVE